MTEALAEPTAIDEFELALASSSPITLPLVHSFTPGVYCRQIFMPAGSGITSRVHRTEHHFVILKGRIVVKSPTEETTYIAPYVGITPPGTRRALIALEDTVWMTIHANPENGTDPDAIAESISDFPENPLIENRDDPRFNIWKKDVSPSLCIVSESLKFLPNQP